MKKYFLCLMAIVGLMTSCSDNDKNVNPLAEQIIGKWIAVDYADEPALTDQKVTLNFVSPTKCLVSMLLADYEEVGGWANEVLFDVTIDGNVVTIAGKISETISAIYEFQIQSLNGDDMRCNIKITDFLNGVEKHSELTGHFVRTNVDFNKDIIGTWEGIYWDGNANKCRFEYLADGTYNFYIHHTSTDMWVKSVDDYSYFSCQGNVLYMRWKNTGKDGICESWDITGIGNGTMTWSALRLDENDEPYVISVGFTKVN